jgi:hypothetical protein
MKKQRDDLPERRARTFQEAANELATSLTTLFRARSHGLIRVVQYGKRPIIPASEFERLACEGLPSIPPGYRRLTRGTTRVGRPRKAKAKATTKAKPKAKRRADSSERQVANP